MENPPPPSNKPIKQKHPSFAEIHEKIFSDILAKFTKLGISIEEGDEYFNDPTTHMQHFFKDRKRRRSTDFFK